MASTKIEWADKVWNPITGCTKISEGCDNCYAKNMANRLKGRYGYPEKNPFKITSHQARIFEPSRWRKPKKVFVGSMTDIFHKDIPEHWIDAIMATAVIFPKHTFMILTKRPERMYQYFSRSKEEILKNWEESIYQIGWSDTDGDVDTIACQLYNRVNRYWPVPNIWLGVTVENQKRADERIPLLLKTPAAKRFLSIEPMLNHIDLDEITIPVKGGDAIINCLHCDVSKEDDTMFNGNIIDWVICGGENGHSARKLEYEWVEAIRNICDIYKTPFFFKGFGGTIKHNRIDGAEYLEFPNI